MVMTAFVAIIASCKKERFDGAAAMPASDEKIYMWLDNATMDTKVNYIDSLGIGGKGSDGFKMEWELGDSLYAIRWENNQARNEYIVLETVKIDGDGKMLFQGTTRGNWNLSDLRGGEHFVLVHGHFVLDPSTNGGVIDFPTQEVTKAGYASHIHHGGVVSGSDITFRHQDGTLANLKKHEYMVADSYVRFQSVTEKDEKDQSVEVIRPYLSGAPGGSKESPDKEPSGVNLLVAHTLLRVTMFMPDDMFEGVNNKLLAVSLRTTNNDKIFHRYYRLHPNDRYFDSQGREIWRADWNDQNDKESNVYLRANMPGTRAYNEENDPGKPNFDQSKTVCVQSQIGGKNGHFVTLYFSLPARPLAPDTALDQPSNLFVTAFTRTHAFRTKKSYKVDVDMMKPGKIVNINVNFASGTQDGTTYTPNYISTKAITDPNLGVTFAPGLVYAVKDKPEDSDWYYGIYENQGEYAGLDQQTDVMGDYFNFGSIDPREVFHRHLDNGSWKDCEYWKNYRSKTQSLTIALDNTNRAITNGTTDVAALAVVEGYNNIFATMSKKESDRVWAHILYEARNGINRGYYYYDAYAHDVDELRHSAHQAKGAHRNLPVDDPRRQMSSTIGIWIGTPSQPSLEDQDKYVFLPSSHQLNNSTSNMTGYDAELVLAEYEDAEHYRYWASADYGKQHVTCLNQAAYDALDAANKTLYVDIPTRRGERDAEYVHHYYLKSELTGEFSAIMKFSTNTRDVSSGSMCERFQVWYQSGNSFHSNSGIKPMDQTFGRVVRPVIY